MFEPNKKYSERELMQLAVSMAEKGIPESDGRAHPMVGTVIARDGHEVATGFRGETPNAHGEEVALAKLKAAQAVGTTVYSTLEPCTIRGLAACTQRLVSKHVGSVVIGMLGPNPDIRGEGERQLGRSRNLNGKF